MRLREPLLLLPGIVPFVVVELVAALVIDEGLPPGTAERLRPLAWRLQLLEESSESEDSSPSDSEEAEDDSWRL